jgi:hypothetical protein
VPMQHKNDMHNQFRRAFLFHHYLSRRLPELDTAGLTIQAIDIRPIRSIIREPCLRPALIDKPRKTAYSYRMAQVSMTTRWPW